MRLPLPPLVNPPVEHPMPRPWGDERDFPDFPEAGWNHRKAVCRRCGLLIPDFEPSCATGEFRHLAKPYQTRALRCLNNGKDLTTEDRDLVPFMRKARRRYLKRTGIRP